MKTLCKENCKISFSIQNIEDLERELSKLISYYPHLFQGLGENLSNLLQSMGKPERIKKYCTDERERFIKTANTQGWKWARQIIKYENIM